MGALRLHSGALGLVLAVVLLLVLFVVKENVRVYCYCDCCCCVGGNGGGVDDAESAESAATILATVVWFARVDQSLKNPNAVVEGPFGDLAGPNQPAAADIEGFHFL